MIDFFSWGGVIDKPEEQDTQNHECGNELELEILVGTDS